MYRCTDCERLFEYSEVVFESHGLDAPPYERRRRCPFCHSGNFVEETEKRCRFCGSKTHRDGEYCSEACRREGEKYYQTQQENNKRLASSPIAAAVREVAAYNKAHGTKYSYGKYFSLKEAGLI